MKVPLFVFCHSALGTDKGLNILGETSIMRMQSYPAKMPVCSVAMRVHLFHEDMNMPHELIVRFIDEDGRPVVAEIRLTLKAEMRQGLEAGPNHFVSQHLTVDFQNLTVPKRGSYAIDLWCRGELIAHAHVEFL